MPLRSAAPVYALRPPSDDVRLVAELRARGRGAASTLLASYGRDIERVVMRVNGRADLADLVHDVFVRALERIHTLREPSALRAGLIGSAVLTAREHIRHRQRRRRFALLPFLDPPALPYDAEGGEALRHTYAILERMDVDERIALALRVIDGMELRDVAAACGCSLATIKRRLSRAQTRFAEEARRDPILAARVRDGARWGDE